MIFSVDLIHTTNIETQPVKGFETNSSAKWVENNNFWATLLLQGFDVR